MKTPEAIGACALITLVSLFLVGAVSNGIVRHAVQTIPLWFPIILGLRGRQVAKWAALPCLAIWLLLMTLIWLFLLGWTQIISGHFTSIEIVLTWIIGATCVAGLISAFRCPTHLSWIRAVSISVAFLILQLVALRISFLPSIERDWWTR